MDQIYEDEKRKFIEEFNDNYNKSRIGSRLIDVLQTILESKENSRMAKKGKLTKEQIKEIKNRMGEPLKKLAQEFGVTMPTISHHQGRINRGRRGAKRTENIEPPDKKIDIEKIKDKELKQPEEPFEAIISETMSFEAHLFELATVHDKKITITIEIN